MVKTPNKSLVNTISASFINTTMLSLFAFDSLIPLIVSSKQFSFRHLFPVHRMTKYSSNLMNISSASTAFPSMFAILFQDF